MSATDTAAPDEARIMTMVPVGAIESLSAGCAFNWSYSQTNSVEKAVIYAAEHYQSPSYQSEARCLIEGLSDAGYAIVDLEHEQIDTATSRIRELEEQVRVMMNTVAEVEQQIRLCAYTSAGEPKARQ